MGVRSRGRAQGGREPSVNARETQTPSKLNVRCDDSDVSDVDTALARTPSGAMKRETQHDRTTMRFDVHRSRATNRSTCVATPEPASTPSVLLKNRYCSKHNCIRKTRTIENIVPTSLHAHDECRMTKPDQHKPGRENKTISSKSSACMTFVPVTAGVE